MKNVLKKHHLAFVLAIVTGFIMIFPQLFFVNSLGTEYKGIPMMKSDGETYYVTRMQQLYNGTGVSNPYYFEDKNLPNIYYTFSESLIAIPGVVLGIPVDTLNLIYKFLFPGIVFLLVYFLLYRLTKNKIWSLTGASLVLLGNTLLSIPDISHLFRLDKTAYSQFSLFARAVNPEFSSIVFFPYVHLLVSAVQSQKNKWYIFMALLFSASFYFYFYSWTFILAANVCTAMTFFFIKHLRQISWKILFVTFSSLVLGSSAILEILAVKASPFLKDLAGIYDVASHRPIISIAWVFVLVVYIWYLKRKKILVSEDYLLIGLFIATLVDVNQQVITGLSVQSGHYHWYFNTPMFFIILMYVCAKWSDGFLSKNISRVFGTFLILLSITSASFIQYSSYLNNKAEAVNEQDFAQVFDWLNKNTPKGSVVMSNLPMSELMTIYTSNRVLESYFGGTYILSTERRGYNTEVALRDLHLGKKAAFRLDYIVWDTETDPDWKINIIKNIKKEASFENLHVYSL